MPLRPYQTQAVQDILTAFQRVQKVMLQMPTGTGKTEVFAEVIRQFVTTISPRKKVLVVVHTRELVDQIQKRLYIRCNIQSGLILAGHEQKPYLQVQVASIQTLIKRSFPQNISLIVVDEAHHSTAKTYRKILNHYLTQSAKLLGVTATPQRLDGTGFRDLFDKLIVSQDVVSFIKDKWLAPVKHLAVSDLDLRNIRIRNGDYDVKTLGDYMREGKRVADVVESYQKYGQGKKAIVFAVNLAHNKKIRDSFEGAGISCAIIDSETPLKEREQILRDFDAGEYRILSNVRIFTEGFDCPDVGLVILARPTKSLTLYLQMIGRVMRPNPNKPYALVLDNAMLWKEHKLVTSERYWTLDGCKNIDGTEVIRKGGPGGKEVVEIPLEIKNRRFEEITDEQVEQVNEFDEEDFISVKIIQPIGGKRYTIDEIKKSIPSDMNKKTLAEEICKQLFDFIDLHANGILYRDDPIEFEVFRKEITLTCSAGHNNNFKPGVWLSSQQKHMVTNFIEMCLIYIDKK